MKSHTLRNLRFATVNLSLTLALLLALAVFVSIPAYAQSGIWQVDAGHSIARLSLGRGPQSVEVGVASVSGSVVFNSSDPADPVVDLNITPDKQLGPNSPEISFKSKRSAITRDGKLAVVGELSVTRLERSVTMDPNEAYHGPEYGKPIVRTDTGEVTLVFPLTSLPVAQNGVLRLSASTIINRERFPQFLATLESDNWTSPVVEDENCTNPATVGEDYSGAICTGTVVTTAINSVPTATVGGEGYYGFEPAVVPDRNHATIALDLKLTQMAPAPSAVSAAAESAGR
jgi:polyisoprenoid-binding protein YceI